MTSSLDVRNSLVEALELDLVGPWPGSELEREVLDRDPSRWYVSGFLAPSSAPPDQRLDETAAEEVDAEGPAGTDDDTQREPAAARKAYFPSAIGMSVLVPEGTTALEATARWGDYAPRTQDEEGEELRVRQWVRTPREQQVAVRLPRTGTPPAEVPVPDSQGLALVASARTVGAAGCDAELMPAGTLAVSVFLVNRRRPAEDASRDEAFAFQVGLDLRCPAGFVARPDIRRLASDWDERVADLQYRDACEFAVGHGVATEASLTPDGRCLAVSTCWVPKAEVERVEPSLIEGVELGMEALGELADGAAAQAQLGELVAAYRRWIGGQREGVACLAGARPETAGALLSRAEVAADRIQAGIDLLADDKALRAFRIANRAMAASARQRGGAIQGLDPAGLEPPRWRPFQLAFILMNLRAVTDPYHDDRELVDLLFFPTGGGKTEAYLGLAAFTRCSGDW